MDVACHPGWVSTPAAPLASYREALLPSPGLWVAAPAISATLGLTVLGVLGAIAAIAVAVLAGALAVVGLLATSARIEVADGRLRAGRALIPVSLLGRVAVLPPDRMRHLRGRGGDARAYLCQRSWIAAGVVVEVADPADSVPYWLLSSREPERLAAAITAAQAATARDEPPSNGSGQAHSRQTG